MSQGTRTHPDDAPAPGDYTLLYLHNRPRYRLSISMLNRSDGRAPGLCIRTQDRRGVRPPTTIVVTDREELLALGDAVRAVLEGRADG